MPNAFSDHYCYITRIRNQNINNEDVIPKPKPTFKITPKIVENIEFKDTINKSMKEWEALKNKFNHNI